MELKIFQKSLEIKLFLNFNKLDAFNISPYISSEIMSKKCELTGKIPMKGHNVSHANNKTKRRFLPNLKKVKFTSELAGRSLKLTVSFKLLFISSLVNLTFFKLGKNLLLVLLLA